MMKKLALIFLLVSLLVVPLRVGLAQEDENGIPVYVRYCNPTRLVIGDDEMEGVLAGLEDRLVQVEEMLDLVENGNLTYLEGISQMEIAASEWVASPIQQLTCLASLNKDVSTLFNEVLIAMLYGQIVNTDASAQHLSNARTLLSTIREESAAAAEYLQRPVPTPEPEIIAQPTFETEDLEATPEPGQLRSADELTTLLNDFLLNNGVVVLSNAGVQPFPDNVVINISLDRYVLNGAPLDLENSLFTLDTLSNLLKDWPELSQISSIRIETYDGATRTMVVETTGDAFRGFYYESRLNRTDFEAGLTITEEVAP